MITAIWQLEVLGRASGKTSSNGLQETSTLHTFFNKWNLKIKCLRNMRSIFVFQSVNLNDEKKENGSRFNFLDQAVAQLLFTSAIPLLFDA